MTVQNQNSSLQSSLNSEASTKQEWQQKIDSFFTALKDAAGSRQNYVKTVMKEVRELQQQYQKFLADPTSHRLPADSLAEPLEACYQALDEVVTASDQQEKTQEQKQKEQQAKKFLDQFTKKYQKTEEQVAQEEQYKQNGDQKRAQKALDNARQAQNLRMRYAKQSRQVVRQQTEQSTEVEQNVKSRLSALIKAPKMPQAQPKAPVKNVPVQTRDGSLKNAKTTDVKQKPVRQDAKTKEQSQDKNPKTKKQTAQPKNQKAFSKDSKLKTVSDDQKQPVTEEAVENSKQLVEEALSTGALVANAASNLLLEPSRDIIKTLRKIEAQTQGLLEEDEENSTDTTNGGARFAKIRDAIRNSKVKLFTALRDGNLRNGDSELVEMELQRVARQGENIANGEASQATLPETVLENGEVSSHKSQEQWQAIEGQKTTEFSTIDDEKFRYYRHWKPVQNVLSYVKRKHTTEVRG